MQKVERRGLRGELLAAFGAKGPQIEELLEYNENVFEQAPAADRVAFPLPNEPFVAAWERYLAIDSDSSWAEQARDRLQKLRDAS